MEHKRHSVFFKTVEGKGRKHTAGGRPVTEFGVNSIALPDFQDRTKLVIRSGVEHLRSGRLPLIRPARANRETGVTSSAVVKENGSNTRRLNIHQRYEFSFMANIDTRSASGAESPVHDISKGTDSGHYDLAEVQLLG
jgi:hypothetical protein